MVNTKCSLLKYTKQYYVLILNDIYIYIYIYILLLLLFLFGGVISSHSGT